MIIIRIATAWGKVWGIIEQLNFIKLFSSFDEMEKETIESAKKIVAEKMKADNSEEFSTLVRKVQTLELKLSKLENVDAKLDLILKKLS